MHACMKNRSLIRQDFGKIARLPSGHTLRDACFILDTWVPATDRLVRRVGRPCKEWVKLVMLDIVALFGSLESALMFVASKQSWNAAISHRLGF